MPKATRRKVRDERAPGTPSFFGRSSKTNPRCTSPLKWPTRLAALPIWEQVASFSGAIWVFKERWKGLSCGIEVRLWRRHTSTLSDQILVSGMASGDVCVGDHSLDVMNRWEVLTMKMRPRPRKAEGRGGSRPSLRDRTGHPPQGRLSRKAREVAHPRLFRSMLKDKPALYFPVKVAHPRNRLQVLL
jgi:hypothetical protein